MSENDNAAADTQQGHATLEGSIKRRKPTVQYTEHQMSTPKSPRSPNANNSVPGTPNPAGHSLSRAQTIAQSLQEIWSSNVTPRRPVGPAPGTVQSLKVLLLSSYINVLLICIPISWALHFVWQHNADSTKDTIIFVFSFLAIVPLAQMLSFTTEELAKRVGETLAGLLNATLGNAVELIVGIIALLQFVGSILSNDLLVLGMCFCAGGYKYSEQGFSAGPTIMNASLLLISVVAVLIPAVFYFAISNASPDSQEAHDVLALSRGSAVILLTIYIAYLFFQLKTHRDLYNGKAQDRFQSIPFNRKRSEASALELGEMTSDISPRQNTEFGPMSGDANTNGFASDASHPTVHETATVVSEEGEEPALMSGRVAIGALIFVTVLVAVTAEFLVDSINGLTESGHISKTFVGLILLPIVGNAAEHVTAVTSSYKDKGNLALGVAIGSSIQIALFVIPLLVLVGWWASKPLTLLFDPFQSIVMFLAILVVNQTLSDFKSNWLEGYILLTLYVIIALAVWLYPGVDLSQSLATC